MKYANTKLHWTALAVARYYDEFGTACRGRDLHPFVDSFHDTPDGLIGSLSSLLDEGTIGHIVVKSPNRYGGKNKTFAYYPTAKTIERLERVGAPTALPDGRPIPDEVDPTIPDSFVATDEDVGPTENDKLGLEYEASTQSSDDSHPRKYDSSRLRMPAEATIGDNSEDDSESEFSCPYCDEGFEEFEQLGGHKRHCIDRVHETALEERADAQADQEPEFSCPYCDEGFEEFEQLGGHKRHCIDRVHETALEERADAQTDTIPKVGITPDINAPPIGDLPTERPVPGSQADAVDWSRIATRLERKAMEAADNDMDETASAYSQFATLAVEGDLSKRTAYILLGTPVLEFESGPMSQGHV